MVQAKFGQFETRYFITDFDPLVLKSNIFKVPGDSSSSHYDSGSSSMNNEFEEELESWSLVEGPTKIQHDSRERGEEESTLIFKHMAIQQREQERRKQYPGALK